MGWLALLLIVGWLLIVGGLRGYLRARKTGDFGLQARDRVGSPQWWSKVISVLSVLAGMAASIADIAGLAPFAPLDGPVVAGVGVALAGLGIIGTVGAQLAMGDSWRGDVDPEARTPLVTSGPFRYVRNPILTSTFVTALGIALVVPNVLAALMLAGIVLAQQVQVRLVEEPYLLRVHGDVYRRYAAVTGRFVPGVGRLRFPTDG
ncbi:MAG TPA: isoprenylcysteine carboxylmethyltransferase family protein [Candidatus Limnocylindrales bacterium]|nr:isoprenylcysteine carboxylmethyltransferase family protein [Candidatus Limnocylindrales bacterium]